MLGLNSRVLHKLVSLKLCQVNVFASAQLYLSAMPSADIKKTQKVKADIIQ